MGFTARTMRAPSRLRSKRVPRRAGFNMLTTNGSPESTARILASRGGSRRWRPRGHGPPFRREDVDQERQEGEPEERREDEGGVRDDVLIVGVSPGVLSRDRKSVVK